MDEIRGALPYAAGDCLVVAAGHSGGEHWAAGRGDSAQAIAVLLEAATKLPSYTSCDLLLATASSIPGNSQLAVPALLVRVARITSLTD